MEWIVISLVDNFISSALTDHAFLFLAAAHFSENWLRFQNFNCDQNFKNLNRFC